jgi:hypothetical protein
MGGTPARIDGCDLPPELVQRRVGKSRRHLQPKMFMFCSY